MPKYKPDAELKERLTEPIEFELAGKDFTVHRVTTKMVKAMMDLQDAEDPLQEILAIFIGKKALEKLGELDAREAMPLCNWLAEQVSDGIEDEEKNSDSE